MLINEVPTTQIPQPSVQQSPDATSQAPDGGESIFESPSNSQTGGLNVPNEIIEGWKEQFPEIFGNDESEDIKAPKEDDSDVNGKDEVVSEENETEKFYDDMKELTPDEREELLNNCSSEDKEILEEVFKYIDENN